MLKGACARSLSSHDKREGMIAHLSERKLHAKLPLELTSAALTYCT